MSTMDCTQLLEIDAGGWANSVTFTADGERLVGRSGNTVGVWRVKDGEQVATMKAEDPVMSVAVSKDGRFIAGTGPLAGSVSVWDATTCKRVFAGCLGFNNAFRDVDFSPDSSRLVSAENNTATIWDIAAREQVRTLKHDSGPVHTAKYSPLGDRIATVTSKSVRVWDSNDGRMLVDTNVPVWQRAILWFNIYLFVAAQDNTIKQIHAATGLTVTEWPVAGDDYSRIALPQHGKFIAYSTPKTLTLWDTETHTQLGSVQHIDDIRSPAFSPDGHLLAFGSGTKIIVYSVMFHFVSDPELDIDSAVLHAWKRELLTDAETSLTGAVPVSQDVASHHVLASRALVLARLGQCDAALVDAEKSIEIQRSLLGYVAKCVALVSMGEKDKGIRVCDIAFYHFRDHTTLLLLIKAVVLFMAGEDVDAMSRMHDLVTNSAHTLANPRLCIVQAYMHVLLGNKHMERSDYKRAIQSFEDAQAGLAHRTSQPPPIVSLISGWKFDDLGITIQQRLCEALFAAGRTVEAAVSALRMVDQEANMTESVKTWVSDFKYRCRGKLHFQLPNV